MSAINDENAFIKKAKQAFDASVDQLDDDARLAIARCRNNVFEHADKKSLRNILPGFMLPAGVLATLALAFVLYLSMSAQTTNGLNEEDLEMLSSSESLEFYEDLEFYQWLDENDLAT